MEFSKFTTQLLGTPHGLDIEICKLCNPTSALVVFKQLLKNINQFYSKVVTCSKPLVVQSSFSIGNHHVQKGHPNHSSPKGISGGEVF